MLKAHMLQASFVSCMYNQDIGSNPVIEVRTNLPAGQNNTFFMDLTDLDGRPIAIASVAQSIRPNPAIKEMTLGDEITFDKSDGLFHKVVIWNDRKIRQRGYSFDDYVKTYK